MKKVARKSRKLSHTDVALDLLDGAAVRLNDISLRRRVLDAPAKTNLRIRESLAVATNDIVAAHIEGLSTGFDPIDVVDRTTRWDNLIYALICEIGNLESNINCTFRPKARWTLHLISILRSLHKTLDSADKYLYSTQRMKINKVAR